jgi:trans-aconitate 2-methyltransferase
MSQADPWNPDRYLRFAAERRLPFDDLVALLRPMAAPRILDLGCGTGELTRELHERTGARETLGLDSSPAMLERAAAHAGRGLSFRLGDAAAPPEGRYDLLFSNAALHWVPDHESLLPRLAAQVAPGGQLAIQVPHNDHHAAASCARAVAARPEFAGPLGGFVRESPVLPPERYAGLLHRQGFREQRVRIEVYAHLLESREALVEWLRGTTLTDYERRMPKELWPSFLAAYREELAEALPDERPFLFTFRRVLVWGRRA